MSGKQRYEWLDTIRGIAIILVIMGHVIGGLESVGGGSAHWLRQIIYSFHMPLMFAVSGYVVKEYMIKQGDSLNEFIGSFLKKNIIALYFPYLVWGYLFWAIKYFIYAGNEPVTIADGINLFWNYNGWVPGWYLLSLLFIRILDMVMQIRNIKLEKQGLTWLLLYVAGGFLKIYLVSDICGFGFFFFIGRYIRKKEINQIKGWRNVIYGLFIIGMILYGGINAYYGKLIIGSCMIVAFITVFYRFNLSMKTVSLLGKNSMIPYVLHAYFTIPVRAFLLGGGGKKFNSLCGARNCDSAPIIFLYDMVDL